MTIANINRTGATQVCIHNRYGRIERAPGKSEFLELPRSRAVDRPGVVYMWVDQATIPESLVRRHRRTRRTPKTKRCTGCLTVHPVTEFVGTLCRGCFCGCGTLEEELADLRRDFASRDSVLRRDIAIIDCVFETGE